MPKRLHGVVVDVGDCCSGTASRGRQVAENPRIQGWGSFEAAAALVPACGGRESSTNRLPSDLPSQIPLEQAHGTRCHEALTGD